MNKSTSGDHMNSSVSQKININSTISPKNMTNSQNIQTHKAPSSKTKITKEILNLIDIRGEKYSGKFYLNSGETFYSFTFYYLIQQN